VCLPCSQLGKEDGMPPGGTHLGKSNVLSDDRTGVAWLYPGYWKYPDAQQGTRMHEAVHLAVKFAFLEDREKYNLSGKISVWGSSDRDISGSLTNIAAAIAGTIFNAPAGHSLPISPGVVHAQEFLDD
jgi:hypothetical protein